MSAGNKHRGNLREATWGVSFSATSHLPALASFDDSNKYMIAAGFWVRSCPRGCGRRWGNAGRCPEVPAPNVKIADYLWMPFSTSMCLFLWQHKGRHSLFGRANQPTSLACQWERGKARAFPGHFAGCCQVMSHGPPPN